MRGSERLLVCAPAALVLAWVTAGAHGGDLAPPAGPVAPTMKTLQQVEPRIPINATTTPGEADAVFRISQPGSYYLTGPVQGVAGKSGIKVASSNVTINLNGFTMTGAPGSGAGIQGTVGISSVTIVGGNIEFWGFHGIALGGNSNARIERVRVTGNAVNGVQTGDNAQVIDCIAWGNVSIGISVGGNNGLIRNCTALGNGSGIRMLNTGVIEGCSSRQQAADGFLAGEGVTIRGCSAYLNGGNGFTVSSGCTVVDCTAANNTLDGINAGQSCTVSGCTVRFNTRHGIVAGSHSTVRGCTVSFSTQDGVRIDSEGLVAENHVSRAGNGGDGAAIHATGSMNRVEGNSALGSDRGIEAGGTGNVIVRNLLSGNTAGLVLAPGNAAGPLLDASGIAASDASPLANLAP